MLGKGNFCEVYKGEWLGTTVAIKQLYNYDVKKNISLFEQEIQVMQVKPQC